MKFCDLHAWICSNFAGKKHPLEEKMLAAFEWSSRVLGTPVSRPHPC